MSQAARLLLCSLTFGLVLASLPRAHALDEPIALKSGKITGAAASDGIQAFRGIPYAAPPVGDLRWREPQPVAAWSGVKACDKFGASAMQGSGQSRGGAASPPMSEDCLFLNVWTPAKSAGERLPVMVWIHGGGWTSGSGSAATYNCESFAKKGIVAVTINYRMGALGFMAHPLLSAESPRGVSGNYGILDQIAALQWVRDNIAAFGGDPNNVTIFGESAGGSSVYVLVASPLAKGLFQKAIAESAWVTETNMTHLKKETPWSESAEEIGVAAARKVVDGAPNGLAALRALSATDALALRARVSANVDGWLLPKSPAEIYARGEQNIVPLIAGTNSGEGVMFASRGGQFETVEAFRDDRKKQLGESADELWKHYGAAKVDDIRTAQINYVSDTMFIRPTREMVRSMAKTPAKTFMYHFTRNARDPGGLANHAAELPYVFMRVNPEQSSAADVKLADTMNSYWAQFAKTGDPNGAGLPAWPAYDNVSEKFVELNEPIKTGTALRKEALDALDRVIEKRLQTPAAAK